MELHLRIEVAPTCPTSANPTPASAAAVPLPAVPVPAEHVGADIADVEVQVERSHAVCELSTALGWYAGLGSERSSVERIGERSVRRPWVLQLARVDTGEVLDPNARLDEVGLLAGERLVLSEVPGPDPAPNRTWGRGVGYASDTDEPRGVADSSGAAAPPNLVVASGPDVGRSAVLSAPLQVGRDRCCDLVLSDPTVSRLHLSVVPDPGSEAGVTVAPSPEARAPVTVNGTTINEPTPVAHDDVVRIGATTLTVPDRRPLRGCTNLRSEVARFGSRAFHRTPYYPAPVQERVFEPLAEIPERPEPPRFAYLAALAPLLFGVTMAFLYSPRMLMFAVFSPIVAVAAYVESRRRASFRFGEGLERYERKLDERRLEIAAAFAAERERRHRSAPDLAALANRAIEGSADLWIRDRHAPDHLRLRIGLGDLAPSITIRPETRGDETLRDELERELARFATIGDVPVTLDLTEHAVVGLVGSTADTSDLAASLMLQAACLHSPEDLVLVAAVSPARTLGSWLKWIPHLRSASSPLVGPHLVTTTDDAQGLLRALLAEAEERLADRDRSIDRRWPRLLVVIDHAVEPEPALVSRLLDECSSSGICVLWLTEGSDRVPRQASAVVNCRGLLDSEGSTLVQTDPTIDDVAVEIDRAAPGLADAVARSLAGVRDASSATGSNALPRIVTMHHAFAADVIDEHWVQRQWASDRGYSLPTPVGMSVDGPFLIDLVAHGPHALIGGTSGSGKSELLMAMVAGLIAFNPPTKVNVLFVDYKGGASSDVFRSAPHTVGYVTNLDALLARRALISLRAELDRRMKLLQGRAKDLAEMIERHPEEAPPSLVIVVDEFATLAKEVPDFVSGVVDIAQRGRSLGIHLILATQRPSGAVNDNILANTNLRMSLRMLDGTESNSVIGTNDAAAIPNPLKGRAFARVGPGELVAFQTAWTGAPCRGVEGLPPIVVKPFTDAGPATEGADARSGPDPLETSDRAQSGSPEVTQLEALLAAVERVATDNGFGSGRSPWLDELPATLDLGCVTADQSGSGSAGWGIPVGLIDDPAAQAQYPAIVDLEQGGGLAVFGTGGSGKTTTLKTLALSAALADSRRSASGDETSGDETSGDACSADGLTIFGLDFASRELTSLTMLPQCSAIASGDDFESVTRVIALLDALLVRRRRDMADASRRGDPAPAFSRVLLLIDDYGNLAQSFEGAGATTSLYQWLEALNRVIVDGRQVGIHTALTANRRAAVKASLLSAISNRIVLRQADSGAYAELGLPSSLTADLELDAGRGFYNGDNLLQLASAADPLGLAEQLHGAVDVELRTGPLPVQVELAPPGPEPLMVPIGLADLSGEPVVVDLRINNLVVVGDPRSGRSNLLAVIGKQLQASGQPVWVVGPSTSPLEEMIEVDRAVFGSHVAVAEALSAWADALEQSAPEVPRPFLLIDDVDLLDEPVLEPVMARLCSLGLRWVASTLSLRGYSTNQLVQDMKKARSILHLRPADARDVQEMTGCMPPLRPGLAMPAGRGVLVQNRVPIVVQTARIGRNDS